MAKAPNCAAARSQSPPSAIRATLSSSGKSARARPRPVSAMSGDREAARHITRTWFEWEIDGLARKVLLVVETDLAMQHDEQDYDAERKSDVEGKSVSVRVDLGGRRTIKKKTQQTKNDR